MKNHHRRRFLRAARTAIALPFLPSLAQGSSAAEQQPAAHPRNLVCIGNMLGFYPEAFWPTGAGDSTDLDSTLRRHSTFNAGESSQSLTRIAQQSTVISGLDHGTPGGHFSVHTFLSGVRQIDAGAMPDGNVTLDQFAADEIAGQTRFPSLTIGSEDGIHGGCQMSWTRTGTRVPPIPGPEQLFRTLFVQETAAERAQAINRFRLQGSILDLVRDQTHALERKLNTPDRQKLDEYLTSVRDVEKRLEMRRSWIDVPRPPAPFEQPVNRNLVLDLPLLYDLILLALQTGSTRIATLELGGDFNPGDLGVKGGYHSLSHHGQKQEAISALIAIDTYQCEQFVRFVENLSNTRDEQGSLLDRTSVLFGSGMGNANSHTNTNLPVVLAGGDFQHGGMLEFSAKSSHRPPLTNLFVSLLQRFGLEVDQFSTSTGTLRGLA